VALLIVILKTYSGRQILAADQWREKMRKAADTLRMGAVLLGALGLGPLVGGGTSYASDLDDVKAAVDANHTAIASLDISKIDAVWAHDGTVIDKEPVAKTSPWVGKERGRISRTSSLRRRKSESRKSRGRISKFKAMSLGPRARRRAMVS
jgi:hypothetical protein